MNLLTAEHSASRAYYDAFYHGAPADEVATLKTAYDQACEITNAWGRAQQALALPSERIRQEPSDDDLSYGSLIAEEERSYRESC